MSFIRPLSVTLLTCSAFAPMNLDHPGLPDSAYFLDKFKEWKVTNPHVLTTYANRNTLDSSQYTLATVPKNPFEAPHLRGLQVSDCLGISDVKQCCMHSQCQLCYGGLSWAFMHYMNLTEPYFQVFNMTTVSDAQKNSTVFCGMSWENCLHLRDTLLWTFLDDKAKASLAQFGIEPAEFFEPGHCPFYLYQQLTNSAALRTSVSWLVGLTAILTTLTTMQ